MAKYRVHYETPMDPGNHTEMNKTDLVEAKTLAEAIEVSLNGFADVGQITLTGFDLMDSFGGIERDTYEIGPRTRAVFISEIRGLIHSVGKAD